MEKKKAHAYSAQAWCKQTFSSCQCKVCQMAQAILPCAFQALRLCIAEWRSCHLTSVLPLTFSAHTFEHSAKHDMRLRYLLPNNSASEELNWGACPCTFSAQAHCNDSLMQSCSIGCQFVCYGRKSVQHFTSAAFHNCSVQSTSQ